MTGLGPQPQSPAMEPVQSRLRGMSASGLTYSNEDQVTLENIHEHVIGKGDAGSRSANISTRVRLYTMLFERPNPSPFRRKHRIKPRTLVMTESAMYLCDEDYAAEWPPGSPPFRVLRSAVFSDITEIVLKDTRTDFTIVVSTQFGLIRRPKRWRLRTENRQTKDRLISELRRCMQNCGESK